MFRRLIRIGLAFAAVGGAGFAVFKILQSRRPTGATMPSGDNSIMPKRSETPLVQPSLLQAVSLRKSTGKSEDHGNGQRRTEAPPTGTAPEATAPSTPSPTPAADSPGGEGDTWVAPEDGGACPASHPVKAKLASGIFHVPGMLAYDRTTPDRCYPDEASAEADGLRKAKR